MQFKIGKADNKWGRRTRIINGVNKKEIIKTNIQIFFNYRIFFKSKTTNGKRIIINIHNNYKTKCRVAIKHIYHIGKHD